MAQHFSFHNSALNQTPPSPSSRLQSTSGLPLHRQARKTPILYIIGQKNYNGVLTYKNGCNEEKFWKEMISMQPMKEVLTNWKKRLLLLSANDNNNKNDTITTPNVKDIHPFRMVLHRLNKVKCSYSKLNGMKGASNCKYFSLLWVPTNLKDGLNENEFNELVNALRQSQYFCNKLNKECIYLSGPSYGNKEETHKIINDDPGVSLSAVLNNDNEQLLHEESDEKFDLTPLTAMCRAFIETIPKNTHLDIECIVHELDREEFTPEEIEIIIHNKSRYKCNEDLLIDDDDDQYEPPSMGSLSIESHEHRKAIRPENTKKYAWQQQSLRRRLASFGGSSSQSYMKQPLPQSGYAQIYDDAANMDSSHHVFAFIWFNVKKRKHLNDSQKLSEKQPALNDCDDREEKKYGERREDNNKDIPEVLPALSVMNKIHQQPFHGSTHYNVELMGYDECYENLDLVVDRKFKKMEALFVLIECIFLPFFVLFPLRSMICCAKYSKIKPRYRPVGNYDVHFEDLDCIEQIPYDISALWRSHSSKQRNIKKENKKNNNLKKDYCYRLIGASIALCVLTIVFMGPVLYERYDENDEHKSNLLFFDCYGPLLWYCLVVFTIIWFSCASRVLIGPKEHLLLYNKLIVFRPISRKKDYYNVARTDWAALTNLSQSTLLSTFVYAFRKGFLELRAPTHELLSLRRFSCNSVYSAAFMARKWLIYGFALLIYFGSQNLEKFERTPHIPFLVSVADDDDLQFQMLRRIYAVCSNIIQWIFLFGFIILWETMIDRINRQFRNVKSLSNLIIRNTYSEYIELSYIDNMLSWLSLENFIKRKGMMLFSSLETPLLSLFVISLVSWGGSIYCMFEGVGLNLQNDNSIFSNSALSTWFYLALLSFVQVVRMLWYGHKFTREVDKQEAAIKSQVGRMHINNLMEFLKQDKLSLEQKCAIQSSQILLSHLVHNEVVPRVFGIQFDKLTAKAVWTAVISAIPTIITFLLPKIVE